ncbi:MAG TPA: M3 family metallopeptidase [Actinomycetaceae bacterium]|nr:M3 family metallopeptidase [Actinomycetaceae bacterium]
MPVSSSNPLAQVSQLPFELPDFAAITSAHVREALDAGMAEEEAEWERIATDAAVPDVENTLVALEVAGRLLDRATTVMSTLVSSVGGDEWDAVESDFTPKLSAHSDKLWLDERIYLRLISLERGRAILGLDEETSWLLSEQLRWFRESGIQLAPEDRERLKELNSEIAIAETEFSQRATKAIEHAALALEDDDLAGLDGETRAALAANAAARGRDGHLLTFLSSSQQPITARLANPDTRRRVLAASLARGNGDDEATDTRAVVLKLARLRAERARLLGHPDHATAVAAQGTAKSADDVAARLGQLAAPAARNASREAEELAALKAERDDAPFEPSDWVFYEERLRSRKFTIDDDALRPYLELRSVIENGVFYAATRLYGITFHERDDLAAYDPDVKVWEVREDDDTPLGLFLGDFYARKGKHGGAWMHNLVEQSSLLGTRPVIMNNLNITKPAADEPTLLDWDETRTCFHEFGHALHGLFSNARYPSLEGTSVPRDFVEFPSQVNEMWMVNEEVLANFARHHQTGEVLPAEQLEKLLAMGTFGQGFATSEYLQATLLDQAWHRLAPEDVPRVPEDVAAFEERALQEAGLANEFVPPRYGTTYFSHAFAGGYDANYYSYIWSEVLDADTVEWFKNEGARTPDDGESDGGLNRGAGQHFRDELLSRGNTRDPLESFREFRGRDAEIGPLLVRRGLE